MLNYSLLCSCSKYLSSFWLKLKEKWKIEEISIFSNSSHLEWRAELLDTILKGTHLGTIPARLGLIWFSSFRGEDLNVKVYDVRRTDRRWRMPSDGKSSHGLWPGELKTVLAKCWHCLSQFLLVIRHKLSHFLLLGSLVLKYFVSMS